MNSNRKVRTLLAFVIVVLLAALPLTALATAEEDANKALATHWIEDFLMTGSPTFANDLAWPGLVVHSNGNDLTLSQVKARTAATLTGSHNHELEIISVLADGDLVAVHWTQRGNYGWPAHGYEPQSWVLESMSIMRIVEGRIAEIWERSDLETFG